MPSPSELLEEFADLCRAEGYSNADFCSPMPKQDQERLVMLRQDLLELLAEAQR